MEKDNIALHIQHVIKRQKETLKCERYFAQAENDSVEEFVEL